MDSSKFGLNTHNYVLECSPEERSNGRRYTMRLLIYRKLDNDLNVSTMFFMVSTKTNEKVECLIMLFTNLIKKILLN